MIKNKIYQETHRPNNPCACGSDWVTEYGTCSACYNKGRKSIEFEETQWQEH